MKKFESPVSKTNLDVLLKELDAYRLSNWFVEAEKRRGETCGAIVDRTWLRLGWRFFIVFYTKDDLGYVSKVEGWFRVLAGCNLEAWGTRIMAERRG